MESFTTLSPIALGFFGSLAAGLMTAVGAAPVLLGGTPTRKWRDISLGFAAGVMLAASFFSLIIPALDAAEIRYGEGAIPALIVSVAILLGMGAVALMNEVIPHEHFSTGREGPEAASLRRVEPVTGFLGAAVIVVAEPLLPWGLAFAAGAMLYVISHEIIPETHRSGHQNQATMGLAIGLVVMLFLDVWLG